MYNKNISNLVAKLNVKSYTDFSVLETPSSALSKVDYYFDSVTSGNKEVQQLLYEVVGDSLIRVAEPNKAFIFMGKGRNGKSVLFRVIEKLLEVPQKPKSQTSDNNKKSQKPLIQCSHEHLEQLCGTRLGGKTTVKYLNGCTCNIAEDQKQPKFIDTSIITRIISGEPISICTKGSEEELIKPYCTLLFSVNEVLNFKETGIYITDRIIVIPFTATFTDDNNRNIYLKDELCQPLALQIIATRAIDAISKALDKGHFTIPAVVEEATNNYFMECNNVAEFCSLYPIKKFVAKSIYYNEYRSWCNYNNKEAVCNTKFGKEVKNLGYRAERYSFKNDRKTYYTAPDFDNYCAQDVYKQYLIDNGISEETASNCTEEELMATFDCISFSDYQKKTLYNSCNSE